ncbi:MAG: hypothetical protein JWQ43_2791 [Glaciihabitans sp.]|nr:hypothetical protein [Glaciihabitans sp.]
MNGPESGESTAADAPKADTPVVSASAIPATPATPATPTATAAPATEIAPAATAALPTPSTQPPGTQVDVSETSPTPAGLTQSIRVLVTLATAVVVIAGLSLGREVIAPFVLAAIIVALVHPVRGLLERRGAPSGLASLAVILCAFVILAAMVALLWLAVQQFISLLRSSTTELNAFYDNGLAFLVSLGFQSSDLDAVSDMLDPASLVGAATSVLGSVTGIATAFFFILAYVIFMAVDAGRFNHIPEKLATAKAPLIASFSGYMHSVRVYFGVNTIFGLIVAVLDGILLVVLDVPGAIIWTILAFVSNFIPNIGFIIGLIPAAIFALLFGGPIVALIVVIGYVVINVVMQTLVQPKFVSDAVHLSLTLTFASVIFWAFVLGALGALLAVPLTLLMRELLIGSDRDAGFSRWITSDTSAKPAKEPAKRSAKAPAKA